MFIDAFIHEIDADCWADLYTAMVGYERAGLLSSPSAAGRRVISCEVT